MSQKWDYKFILRRRVVVGSGVQVRKVSDWEVFEDGKPIDQNDMLVVSKDLGQAGWELVSAMPRSSLVEQSSVSLAGVTSDEVWVFKRAL